MSTSLFKLLPALAFCAILTPAQVTTGSISGSVTDPNGAAVPEARITARNEDTGLRTETVSNGAGQYVFASIQTGRYTVSVEVSGFKRLNRGGLDIRAAERVGLDLQLEVGDVQQSVEVTAVAPLLENASSERGQTVSAKMMDTLPLFSGGIRNPEAFVSYMPGVNQGAEMSISGSGGRGKEVMIDGGSLTIPESGGVVFNFPASEMFGEFKLLTGTYSAEYGRFGGGVELFITKSGGNDVHGRVFWNMRRDIWNANSWNNNRNGFARAKERFNEGGVALGGPVFVPKVYNGRNKTFWFFTLTRDYRPATASQALYTMPTAAMKRGDFSGFRIYDPLTTNGTDRLPFANNVIPTSRLSKIASAILPDIPDPTRPTAQNNFDFVNTSQRTDTIWSMKFDHAFTPNNRVAYFHSLQSQDDAAVTGLSGPLGVGLGASFNKPQYVRGNHDLIIRSNVLLHTTVSFSRTRQGWDNLDQVGYASKVGIAVPTDATPRIRFSARDALSPWGIQDGKVSGGGSFNGQRNTTYQVTSGLSWLRGRHEFKIGGEVRRMRTFAFDAAGSNGLFSFENFQTALPTDLGNTGHSFASFLLGSPDRFEVNNLPVPQVQIRYGYHSGYLIDNWKIHSKLTLNLGLRYEVPVGWHMSNYNMSTFDPDVPNPGAGGLRGAMTFMGAGTGRTGTKRPYPTDYTNVGPRIGFAYSLTSKTVIRGGYGVFYQTLGNGGCGCTLGFGGRAGVTQSDGRNPAFLWDTGIPLPSGGMPPFIDPTIGNFLDVDYIGPDFGRAPRIYNWSFNVQHTVKNFLIDVAYVGNRGHGLNSTLESNQVDPKYLTLGALLQQPITAPQVTSAGYSKPFAAFPNNQTLAQALRPFPQYLNIADRNSGDGQTWYDSLQAKVERRFGSWQTMFAYTWSKSLSTLHFRQIFSQNFNVGAQDNYNLGPEKSYLPFDQPHVFSWLSAYDLPMGKGKKFFANSGRAVDTLTGGWTVSTTFRYSVPSPIRIASTNTLANVLYTRARKANTTGNAIRGSGNRTDLDPGNPDVRWFNPCQVVAGNCVNGSTAFSNPGTFDFGSGAWYQNDFRNPRVYTESLAIHKNFTMFKLGEHAIQLRYSANIFNLFNRTNFGVDTNFQSVNFGRATGPQQGPRIITMGLMAQF